MDVSMDGHIPEQPKGFSYTDNIEIIKELEIRINTLKSKIRSTKGSIEGLESLKERISTSEGGVMGCTKRVTARIKLLFNKGEEDRLQGELQSLRDQRNDLRSQLIKQLNFTDINGNTGMMLAVRDGNIEAVKTLIEEGADITAKNDQGENALDIAIKMAEETENGPEIVNLLLKNEAECSYSCENFLFLSDFKSEDQGIQECVLKIAGEMLKPEVFMRCIRNEDNDQIRERFVENLTYDLSLDKQLLKNSLDSLREILNDFPDLKDSIHQDFISALNTELKTIDFDFKKRLMKEIMDFGIALRGGEKECIFDPEVLNGILHKTFELDDPDAELDVKMVQRFLDLGGDPNIRMDADGTTAMMLAVKYGSIEAVQAFLKHGGIDLNAKNEQGKTALDIASNGVGKLNMMRDGVDKVRIGCEIASLLVNRGVSFSCNEENLSCFINCTSISKDQRSQENILKNIDKILTVNPELRDTSSFAGTALSAALSPFPNLIFIKKFLDHGTSLNSTILENRDSWKSVLQGNLEDPNTRSVAKMFIEKGMSEMPFPTTEQNLAFMECLSVIEDVQLKKQCLEGMEEMIKVITSLTGDDQEKFMGSIIKVVTAFPDLEEHVPDQMLYFFHSHDILDGISITKFLDLCRKEILKNPEDAELLSHFRDLYLENLFKAQKDKILNTLPVIYKARFRDLEPALDELHKIYRDNLREEFLEKQHKNPLEALKIFLEEDLTKVTGEISLFTMAVLSGKPEIVESLITNGSQINLANTNGQTPLHLAILDGRVKLAELLIQHKASLVVKNSQGRTPLTLALEKGHLGCAQLLIKNGAYLDEADKEKFGDVLIQLENLEESMAMDTFMDTASTMQKEHFKIFLKMAQKERGEDPSVLTPKSDAIFDTFSQKVDAIFHENLTKIPSDKKDFDEFQTNILSDLQDLYLEFMFNEQENSIIKLLPREYANRLSDFKSTLNVLHRGYRDEQKNLLNKQQNNSLALFEKFLEKDRLKVEKEMSVFSEMVKYKRPEPPKGIRWSDLYLRRGVCYGASLFLASKLVEGKSEATIQPSSDSRFYQAAYRAGRQLDVILKKKIKELKQENAYQDFKEMESIDVAFQKNLGVNIESTAKTSKSSVYGFIQNIDSLIPKLHTENSSHFVLIMRDSKEETSADSPHSAHAIYCHLTPDYEIQDVNYPGFSSLKTDDPQQFKMYLLFYFLFMAPRDYQEISDIEQISKRSTKI